MVTAAPDRPQSPTPRFVGGYPRLVGSAVPDPVSRPYTAFVIGAETPLRPLGVAFSLLLVACGAPDGDPLPVRGVDSAGLLFVENGEWVPTHREPEAFTGHAPATIDCEPGEAWRLTSDGALDIDTGTCNYLALEQPALSDIPSGAVVSFTLAHLQLYDPESEHAQAHVAFMAGDALHWERSVDIPAPARIYRERIELEHGIEADEPVFFHLHNHGANEWKLLEIVVETK